MATMIKEKRREKKKVKEKTASTSSTKEEQPSFRDLSKHSVETPTASKILESEPDTSIENYEDCFEDQNNQTSCTVEPILSDKSSVEENILDINQITIKETEHRVNIETKNKPEVKLVKQELYACENVGNTYQDINSRLERMTIPSLNQNLNLEEVQARLEKPQAYLELGDVVTEGHLESYEVENAVPSAPMFEEPETIEYSQQHENIIAKEIKTRPQSMPLEDAIKLYGGTEMETVRVISEKEEAIVEAGPVSGPEHPLVDLLSTFRSSLIAVDREHMQLSKGFKDEEKLRKSLWKIEKIRRSASETCPCGALVTVHFTYEQAELLKERLPVAKLKLEGLLRDVQESYCHHQHTALLTHCQIEELIYETTKSNKKEIREALALVLQALRLSDSAPASLATALERWASALSAAMLDARDIRQLLHLLHHLSRQMRSVRWASRVIRSYIRAGDHSEAAQAIALLNLLIGRPRLEPALECTEDADESWEEMDKSGGSGAVSEGSLRERDLMALLRSFPARELVARIVLFKHSDVSQAREQDWGDRSYGSGVLKACCGVRALLATLQRGVTSHPTYTRLHAHLKGLAVSAMHALSSLHLQSKDCYSQDMEDRVSAELEAIFCAGVQLLGNQQLQEVPATLLDDHTAREYCCVNILALHDTSPKPLDFLSIDLPVLQCGKRVSLVTRLALDRLGDHELARTVLEFLFQTGIRRAAECAGGCRQAAREHLPQLLHAHSYLHTVALHTLAECCQVEQLDPSSIDPLSPQTWRPTTGEVRQLLEDWSLRCPQLIQHLLLKLNYTPHTGLSLDTQLTIISWLCHWLKQSQAPPPDWAWSVLRATRPHRTWWGVPLHAPPPDPPPEGLFAKACAVLASSWGHSIPLICSEGLEALCKLAAARPGDAAHCLGPVMRAMAHSPESISLTPKFTELLSALLSAGPTIVQRALGFGPERGADLLQRLILAQIEHCPGLSRSSLVSAWLHALWKPSLPSHGLLETILLASREWLLFDAHAARLMQDKNASDVLTAAVRNASAAPLVCACVLRARAGDEARGGGQLFEILHHQRGRGEKIHVDNALKHMGANMTSEDLVIYRCATALLSAPTQSPAHLTLWAFFFHLYLQRPPSSMLDSTSPIGPLFFSGLIKSRVLTQLRKKLQETVAHHHDETTTLKQNTREETPQAPSRSKHNAKNSTEDDVLPKVLLSWESSESSDSESNSDSSEENKEEGSDVVEKKEDLVWMLKYHAAAENMCKEYLRWLEEGDKTRAMPHHADIARFIPEQVLGAAWSHELASRRTPPPAPPAGPPPALPASPPRPFHAAMARILTIKDCSWKRSRRPTIKSPQDLRDLSDARHLLLLVDKYLADMETLAEEWCTDVSRISSLDSALWDLVCKLRVARPLPPVRKQCSNKCNPLTIHAPIASLREWCISTGAERGIEDNRRTARGLTRRLARPRPHAARSAATLMTIARRTARGLTRRLARPRPHAARSAAALMTIARHVSNAEAAWRVCERAWNCARTADQCALVSNTLTALVGLLADRWLCNNGKICSELLSRWGNNTTSSLQQALCGALVSPRSLPAPQWPAVYCAVLRSRQTPHVAFSYLSKFEISRWVEVADHSQKSELLEALVTTAQKYGCDPDTESHVLLELLGVHTATLLSPAQLCAHITRSAHASVARTLPPSYWPHVTRAALCHARNVPFDQLGHLLRSLGSLWWEARLKGVQPSQYDPYAQHTAELLSALIQAFTASTRALSYTPERVCLYVWSGLQEAWSPWVSPHHAATLQSHALHAATLHTFVETIHQVMVDCPGIEEDLLQKTFEWVVQTYFGAMTSPAQECRVQLASLLEEMRGLPWTEHQWVRPTCLQAATQVCASNQKDIQSWCLSAWRGVTADSWLRGVDDQQTAPLLASLLYLFTAMPQHEQTLEQATLLPWWRLPERALEEALERFFVQHHNPTVAYHDLPQFRVILYASELLVSPSSPPSRAARNKRATALSRWVCAACAPTLAAHVPTHTSHALQVLTDIAPHLDGSGGELEQLMGRALAVMCIEPAASAALPVWCGWVSCAPAPVVQSCVSASGTVTAFEYFAALADASIRAHCTNRECGGWSEVCSRLAPSPWREAGALAVRGRLHAAYAVLRTHAHSYDAMRTAFNALLTADVNFIEDEVIIAVWICLWCRVAAESGASADGAECGAAARAALARGAEEPRRSLLRMVTMQADSTNYTPRHRLLSRLALCILSPSDSAARAYEASCAAVPGSTPDVVAWGRAPKAKHLPRLAIRLFPDAEKYFKDELDLAADD